MTLQDSIWADSSESSAPSVHRRSAAPPTARPAVTITQSPLSSVAAPAPLARAAAFPVRLQDVTNVTPRAASPAVPAASGPKLFNPASKFLAEAKAFSSEVKGGGSKRGDRSNTPVGRRYAHPVPPSRHLTNFAPSVPPAKSLATDRGVTTVQVGEQQREKPGDAVKPRVAFAAASAQANVAGDTKPPLAKVVTPVQPSNPEPPQGVQRAAPAQKPLAGEKTAHVSQGGHASDMSIKEATKESLAKLPPHKRLRATAAMQLNAATPAPAAAAPMPPTPAAALVQSWAQKKADVQEALRAKLNAAESPASSAGSTGFLSPQPITPQPITATYETDHATISATVAPLDFNNAEHNAAAIEVAKNIREQMERAGRGEQKSVQPVVKDEPVVIKDEFVKAETPVSKDEKVVRSEDKTTQFGGSPVHKKVAVQLDWSQRPGAKTEAAADDQTRNGNSTSTCDRVGVDNPPQASASQVAKSSLQDVKEELIKLMLEKTKLEAKRQQLTVVLEQVAAMLINKEKHILVAMAKLSES